MAESRAEAFYVMTDEQIKQIIQATIDAFVNKQNDSKSIYNKKICSKSEAARHFNKNRTTIYHMIADGRLRATKDGKVIVQSIIDYEKGTEQCEKARMNKRGHKVYV